MSETVGADSPFASVGGASVGAGLMSILMAEDVVPGSNISYQLAKDIYAYHPIGGKMAENPVNMAQSQDREISIPGGPESVLIPAFQKEWKSLGKIGADTIIKNVKVLSRVYGISSIVCGNAGVNPAQPLKQEDILRDDIYFNVLDPLNTAGSLILEQDPKSPDFMKPKQLAVGGQAYHPSRACVSMNEQPIYISWNNAGFGFNGRSIYQRALFPLKSFIQSMITDQMVMQKCGLIVAKMKTPTSSANNRVMQFFGWKRQQLKAGSTGQVLTIGHEEDVESLNLQNLEGPARMARENILKNIATADGMPARMLDQETLVSGFGEGAEDAKQIARYIDRMRIEMLPLYTYFDNIVMRRAWSPGFYESVQAAYPEYKDTPYETAFYQWKNSFTAIWPNLLTEPDSEKAKAEKAKFEVVVAYLEAMNPILDPKNKAALGAWAAEQVNESKTLFTGRFDFDEEALMDYIPPEPEHEHSLDSVVADRL